MYKNISPGNSRLASNMNHFIAAVDNKDEVRKELYLQSTVVEAVLNGLSSDDVLQYFSKKGVGGRIFTQNITQRFILAEAI